MFGSDLWVIARLLHRLRPCSAFFELLLLPYGGLGLTFEPHSQSVFSQSSVQLMDQDIDAFELLSRVRIVLTGGGWRQTGTESGSERDEVQGERLHRGDLH